MSSTEPAPVSGPILTPPRVRRDIALTALLVLALFYTAWAASDVLVPVVLAMAIALITNPAVSLLERLWLPRWLGALGVLLGGLAAFVLLASVLVQPAAQWLGRAPSEIRQHAPKLRELTKPFAEANRAANQSISELTGTPPSKTAETAPANPAPDLWSLVAGAPIMLATIGGILLLAYFFLLYGETLQRRAINVMPTRLQQRITLDILRSFQVEVSRYVLTVSLINLALGIATALALWAVGLDPRDALLWGLLAGLLNFAPYAGPLIGLIALTLVGLVEFSDLTRALMVPGAFLVLTSIEGQFLTPMILGRQLSLSPLVILLWLVLWAWLWGILGILLAVPMLVCFKIVAARVEGWRGWAEVIER